MVRVDPKDPRANLSRHANRFRYILRPYRGGKAVLGVVRKSDGVFFRIERRHRQYRSKNLFAENSHRWCHVVKDRRLEEIPLRELLRLRPLTAAKETSALVAADLDVRLDLLPVRRGNQRAHF